MAAASTQIISLPPPGRYDPSFSGLLLSVGPGLAYFTEGVLELPDVSILVGMEGRKVCVLRLKERYVAGMLQERA